MYTTFTEENYENTKSSQSNDENQVIFDISMAIPEADVLKELGITEEELDAMDYVELDLSELSKDEIVKELEKGIEDSLCGRTTPAKDFFNNFRENLP